MVKRVDGGSVETLQQTDYYPFGMVMGGRDAMPDEGENKYLYNGKELQGEFDLGWYDYGTRMYDAALGRWHSIDPKAEEAYNWTPYRYAFNNPINVIDPDGQFEDWYQSESGATLWLDENKKQVNIDGETYENIGKSVSIGTGDGNYINYYENAAISISDAPIDAESAVLSNPGLKGDLLSKDSPLSQRAQSDLNKASIHSATSKAADVILTTASIAAPMPKIGLGTKLAGKSFTKLLNFSDEVTTSFAVKANFGLNAGKRSIIKSTSKFVWNSSSYAGKRKIAKSGTAKAIRNISKTDYNFFGKKTYDNLNNAWDIYNNLFRPNF
jgi:RHS repeat-associated protein